MLALNSRLAAVEQDSGEYRPRHFRLPGDKAALQALLEQQPGLRITDRIQAQVRELVKSLHPGTRFTEEALQEAAARHLAGRAPEEYGCWVYYPWGNRLVHLLDADEFGLVRTDRNRQKITREEQAVLARKKVGVIGLSVGQSVSLTMALERTFGEIRLADFDSLDLSNLNRIRAGAHNLGLNKAIITAREIAEIDPYLHVVCFTDGLTQGNMDAFFTEGGKLDVLVEECDSVDIKILARQKAKALGIPVVMDMSDRGCLDVERFDLEPGRPLMHGWIDHLDLEAASRPMTADEKVPYMLPITGVETLSARMKASVIELGQSISTWPQLATSVVLGGALAGDAVRRVALDQFHSSGRWFVDMEELVGDPPASGPPPAPAPPEFQLGAQEIATILQGLGPAGESAADPGEPAITRLVEAGGLAPSEGNMQPWKFHWEDRRLLVFHDESRSASVWDPEQVNARMSLGACIENIVLKAHSLAWEVGCRTYPLAGIPRLAAALEFAKAPFNGAVPHATDHLAAQIEARHTNRKITKREALPEGALPTLDMAASSVPGCRLHVADDPAKLQELARLCGAAERLRLLDPQGHREYFTEQLRWEPEAAGRTLDGIDVRSLELPPAGLAAMRMASDRRAMDLLAQWNAGNALGQLPAFSVITASAVLLLTHAKNGPGAQIDAGRSMERCWLAANGMGLSVHPLATPLVTGGASPGGHSWDHGEWGTIRHRFLQFWGLADESPLILLRIGLSGPPGIRSLRRPAEKLFV